MLRERDNHFDQARPYDFCNCITTHGHVRERLILALERGLPFPSFPRAASLRLLCERSELRAADRFRRPAPPSWGGEDDTRVKGPSEGCRRRPEGALARFFFGAGSRG